MPRRIEGLSIPGPAGRLEALLEEPEHQEPREAVLVCHPHPLHGGTMHNKVVYRIARGLRKAGAVVLRFNFRGVNLSEGVHDNGRGEVEDARFCLQALRERYPSLPYSLAGFSFGSRVALRLGCSLSTDPPRRIIAVGFPTTYAETDFLARCPVPRIFIHSTQDEHGPKADFERFYAGLQLPKEIRWVKAQDHFFAGALDEFEAQIVEIGTA